MLADLQLFSYGVAAVLETVLLVAMLERRNRRTVSLWMLLVSLGAWLWNAGSLADSLLVDSPGPLSAELRWLAMSVMAAGLLLMPSALLHGIARLKRTGLEDVTEPQAAFALCYLPLLALFPVVLQLRSDPAAGFRERVQGFIVPYVLWIGLANTIAAIGFLRYRRRVAGPRIKEFLCWFAGTLFATAFSTAFVFLFAVHHWPRSTELLSWSVSLLPVLPALLFAYYVIRFQMIPLVLERTLVYGGIVVGLWLLHRLAVDEVTGQLSDHYRIHFSILEAAVALALILVYQPLRQRIAESLRYLLGARVATVRGKMRKLAVAMSERAGQPAEEIVPWFAAALAEALHAGYVACWLFTAAGNRSVRGGNTRVLSDDDVVSVQRALDGAGIQSCSIHDAPSSEAERLLFPSGATFAVRLDHPQISGLCLIGPLSWHRQPGEEELSFLLLLIEQLGSIIHNNQLQSERQAAERRALQSEKLAALGLVAGSLAHEIRNPLSSIKTIATVVAEQLAADSPHREDLRLILGEIDRLSATTTQMLEFARPASGAGDRGSVSEVLESLLRLLRLVALQKNVALDVQIPECLPVVRADEQALREIFFNLLSNSIEATGPGGRVCVACHQDNGSVIAAVSDDGPGIPPALVERIFDPFVTTKETGTGLGLYAVSRRVHEFGGDVHCRSDPRSGTTFTVRLPCS